MNRVGILAGAHTPLVPAAELDTSELAFEAARAAVAASGLRRSQIGLVVSASSDVAEGRPFHFLQGIEALGVWPATNHAHVESDGAWAAFYAWVRLLSGEIDAALVVAWSKTSEGSLHHLMNTQLDPFCLAPLGLDHVASAALQADAVMRRTGWDLGVLDAVAARAEPVAEDEPVATPLWRRHCPRPADAACAVVLARSELTAGLDVRPVWVAGVAHATQSGALGHRDLSRLDAARNAHEHAMSMSGWTNGPDIAEVGAAFAHQEPLLVEQLGLHGAEINPSGGPLAADPVMATGLVSLHAAADHVRSGARRVLSHAAAGHAMQQNIVWLLEEA